MFSGKHSRLCHSEFFKDLSPDVKYAVNRKAGTAGRRVDHKFIFFRIEHFNAHIDNVSRRKILSFLAFGRFIDEILKRLVNDVEVGVEKLDVLQRGNADRQMRAF